MWHILFFDFDSSINAEKVELLYSYIFKEQI